MAFGITEYPNQIKRQDAFALDKSSKYRTYAAAEEYAKYSPIAYNLQIVGVDETNSLYVLTPSIVPGENFVLSAIGSGNGSATANAVHSLGTWALTTQEDNDVGLFDFELTCPIDITHYTIKIDNEIINERLPIGTTFEIPLDTFKQKDAKILISFEKVDESHAFEVLRTYVTTVYDNANLILGILTTEEIHEQITNAPLNNSTNTSTAMVYPLGSWALTTQEDKVDGLFDFEFTYPIDITHYTLIINDDVISNQTRIGTPSELPLNTFKQEGAKIIIVLEKVTDSGDNKEILRTLVKTTYSDSMLTLGMLTFDM